MTSGAPGPAFPRSDFDDILDGNRRYAASAESAGLARLTGRAAKGIALLTCMDSRIDPLGMTGLRPGDAKILRNAGARVSEDVLRTLVLASYLLGVERVLVIVHSDCRMASATEQDLHATIFSDYGVDTRSLEFRTTSDQVAALRSDLVRIRSFPLLPRELVVAGALYDVESGELRPVDG